MSHRTKPQRRSWKERALCLLLSAVMLAGMMPGTILPASAHWADGYLSQLVDWGVMRADQAGDPNAAITRAEFAAIVNRAYGYNEVGPIPFTDVQPSDWFYDDIRIAYTAGYMAGTSSSTAAPHGFLTREMATCILARNMMMKESPAENLAFADSREISSWARGLVKTAVDNYVLSGYPDNRFGPKNYVSKGEMAALVTRCVGNPLNQPGEYTLGDVFNNVTITSSNVTLRDTSISGDLYVSGGVGLGNVKLENVRVLGRIIVSGTGESELGDASVVMRNVTAEEMLVDNMRDKTVTLRAEGLTNVAKTVVRTNAYLEDNAPDENGLRQIVLEGNGTQLDLAGRIKEVLSQAPRANIQVAKGTVEKLTVDEASTNATVQIDRNTEVKELNLDVAANIIGDGDVKQMNINAPGVTSSVFPEKLYIRPGLTGNVGGEDLDSAGAEEYSRDPKILSGYPIASDVAPTSLRADFATNKKGTVYWAVSNVTDGSLSAGDLVSPPSYGSAALKNGSIAVPSADTVVNAQVTGLTAAGAYYLSAVMQDNRGVRSPVKVISFTTPDNSKPAFAQGYPRMSLVTDTLAQAVVMPTKSCKLYYAVLPQGAAAPTPNELRSASVTGNLGYGVLDVVKNTELTFTASNRLEELKDYVLYLWLCDADGTNSSNVQSLRFKTVDATPPVFVIEPMLSGDPQATSVPLSAALNENGTIFWVVTEDGADYPKPNNQRPSDNESDGKTAKLTSDFAKLQVANGMNGLRAGRVNATANKEVKFNITGLQAEKTYDLYYLAQDTAGNYSISVMKIQGGIHTADNSGPVVRQFFTKYSGVDETKDPMSDTDIVLEFNENICLAEAQSKDIMSLFNDRLKSDDDMKTFTDALRRSFVLYRQVTAVGEQAVKVKGDTGVNDSEWVIDYKKAQVKNEDGKYRVIFPADGLQLSSGATYFFRITGVTDNSVAKNPIKPNTVQDDAASKAAGHSVPRFTVVFARVFLTQVDLVNSKWPKRIDDINKQDTTNSIGDYKVDFSFRMIPDATSTVEPGMAYDLLLWTDTTIQYDLYYRVVRSDASQDPVTDGSWTDQNGRTYSYAMPNKPANSTTMDTNGWVFLGDSREILTNGRELFGKSLHVNFNGCNQGSFPDINTLDDTGSVYYEFAISLRKMGTGTSSTNPDTWSGTVNFYVDAAAGTSGNLHRLQTGLSEATWSTFTTNGLNNNGGESIGSTDNLENPKRLKMSTPFSDSLQPSFAEHFPTFESEDTSVVMNLTLDRPGTIYYAIAPADNTGRELPNETTWVPTIRTLVAGNNGTGQRTILPSEVPEDGDHATSMGENVPKLLAPEKGNIFRPNEWAEAGNAITGSVNYQGVATRPSTVTGLEPDRTYYAYFVITGTAREPSEVYIYKFKTNPTARPLIDLKQVDAGMNMTTTNMNSYLSYVVYPKNDLLLFYRMMSSGTEVTGQEYKLSSALSEAAKAGKGLPKRYENFTILQALETKYSYNEASSQGPTADSGQAYYPKDGKGRYTSFDGYSVFDIYASEDLKQTFYSWISTGNANSAGVTYDTTKKAPETAQAIPSVSITQNRYTLGGDKIDPGADYYILTVARSQKSSINDPAANVCSFLAMSYHISDRVAPKLTNVTGNFSRHDATAIKSGTLVLSFDKPLYTDNNGNDEVKGNNFFGAGNVSGSGFSDSNITVTNTRTGATVTIKLDNKGEFTAVVPGGYLKNDSGVPIVSPITITHYNEITYNANQTTQTTTWYVKVTWTPPGEREKEWIFKDSSGSVSKPVNQTTINPGP